MNARACLIAIVLAASASACDGAPTPSGPTPTSPAALAAGCPRVTGGTAAASAELNPGPSNGLARSTARGQSLVIEAVILQRDCQPAAGAVVHLWHADAQGRYGPAGTEQCCYYDGTVQTDGDGRFRLHTIRPAEYPVPDAPPAHIHLEISHSAGRLETEIVFGSEPPVVVATPTGHELSVALQPDGAGWRGEAMFVLAGSG